MKLTKKVRIYPDSKAVSALWSISQACAFVWNYAVGQNEASPWVNIYERKRELVELKKKHKELQQPSSQIIQNVIIAFYRALKASLIKIKQGDAKARLPQSRKTSCFFTHEYSQPGFSFTIDTLASGDKTLKLAYGKRPSDWISIPLPPGSYPEAKTVVIAYQNKKWYACITYDLQELPLHHVGSFLYFDPGVKVALTGIKSNGKFYEYDLKPLYEINIETYLLLDKLKAQRDAKRPYAYHWLRLNARINALYSKIRTRTKEYLHTLSNKILSHHADVKTFFIGDWSKKDTLAKTKSKKANKKINRAVQNNHPLEKLIGYLTYKGRLNGQDVQRFDERGTTRSCSQCNFVYKKGLNPSVRVFTCQQCLFKYPRDHQSCLNIVKKKKQCCGSALTEQYRPVV